MDINVPFTILVILSLLIFAISCISRFSLLTVGGPDNRINEFFTRIFHLLTFGFLQRRVAAEPFGLNHVAIFWSFLVLAFANGEFLVTGMFPDISFSLLPGDWPGYIAFIFDLVSLLTIVAIIIAVSRRLFFPPSYIDALSRDAFFILGLIALLMFAFFFTHGAELALKVEDKVKIQQFMPISSLVATMLQGMSTDALHFVKEFSWWIHAVALLIFLNYLPYSKHMHILTALPNCFMRSLKRVNTVPREEFTLGNNFGSGQVDRMSWKDLFDSYSCTECGRCTQHCPANHTGKPLNPREIIHDIKDNLLVNGPRIRRGQTIAQALIAEEHQPGTVSEEALWDCTTCGACMEACPVFIEQMPKIITMRRQLVEMEAKMPDELITFFENMEQRSNPWGLAPSERTKWSAHIDVKPFSAETEYLFFVGCAGALDSRSRQVTLAMAKILDSAGISWGILGKDEMCCGDSLRRLGNEYLFDRQVRQNIELFKARGVTKIIVTCPHCFSTLKNDYQQFGVQLEVIHHSEFIQQLLANGKLKLNTQTNEQKIVFHDSCYLGRHNNIYQQPRQAITAATGTPPLEMKRNHAKSFCCGAGGGRMWMEESTGTRINVNRVQEALTLSPDKICVTCPYCMTMFEDGLKDQGVEDKVTVIDIAEVVAAQLPNKVTTVV